MIVQVPEVALGTCSESDTVGVHDTDVDVVFVAIVPVAFPNLYVRVCVNELDALLIDTVVALPIVTADADTLDALGIVFNVCVPLAVQFTA